MTRKIPLLILLLLWSNPAWATNWCEDANAVACYSIEEGSGITTADLSSNSNTGNFKGSGEPAWDSGNVPGPGDGFNGTSNYSVDYDNVDDEINIGHDASIDSLTTLTVVAWIYIDALPSASTYDYILSQRDNSVNRWQLHINSDDEPDGLRGQIITSGNNAVTYVDTVTATGEWLHSAFRYDDGGDRKWDIFVDGVESGYSGETASTGTIVSATSTPLSIGNRAVSLNRCWNGNIDELSIFDDIKDSTDINDMMTNGLVQVAPPAGRTRRFF